MLSYLYFVLTVTGLSLSHTESRETSFPEDICNTNCTCQDHQNILNIYCENKGFTTFRQFRAPPDKISQLFLNGNVLPRIETNEFIHFGIVTSLYLGNNSLQEIRPGAFNGLSFLKRLDLNNNSLNVIQNDTLAGLKSLEYLWMDYNYISTIDPEAFGKLTKLKVLILNDNLLSFLPPNIFCFMPLIRLDLRGNRLNMLPLAGVLKDMGGIVEIKLQGNPWDCTCDLILLKYWRDTTSLSVGDIVCETPSRLHGKDITQLLEQDLCPRRNAGEPILPPSDSHFQGTLHPAVFTPTHANRVYQTPSPIPMLCPSVCSCTSQNPDSGLNIDCRERKLQNISELTPKLSDSKKLYLERNYFRVIYRLDLAEFSSLEVLHLGNNRITVIQEGAFENLTNLQKLYLNRNNVESLSQFLFAGLQSLRYLYLQYNFIKDMSPHAFSALHNLRQIVLNNNLLHSLPDNVFRGTMLERLNLRYNRFSHLPVQGVLDQLPALINIGLQGNPWDCTCPILALKDWMELPSVVASEIACNSPSHHAGRLLRSISNEAICPEPSEVPPPQHAPPTKTLTSVSTTTPVNTPEPRPKEPFSALMLSLVTNFILSICFITAIFKFVLKRRRGVEHVPTDASNLDPANPYSYSVPGVSTITTRAFIEKYPPSCGLTPPESPETLYEIMEERPN